MIRFFPISLLAGSFALLLASVLPTNTVQAQAADRSVEDIEQIVREYLLSNPEVILQALRELERREQAAADTARSQSLGALAPTLTASPLTPVFDHEESDVTLVEFFDYQCGFCKRIFPAVQNVMAEDKKLRVIFVEYPILGPASVTAARAALASKVQGKYLDFHTALMTHQGRLTDAVVFQKAVEVGLDVETLRSDMEAPEIAEYLDMTRSISEALQIRGTPAMVIGDEFVGGFIPEDQIRAIIENAREKQS